MQLTERFRINTPDVVLEDFGDEVVIVNLGNGNYYSVDSTGAEIWALIEQGASTAEVVEALCQRYSGASAEIEAAALRFVSELAAEGLVIAGMGGGPVAGHGGPAGPPSRPPFSPPTLNKYTDMQELLLIDPIHDVDDTGWPNIELPLKKDTAP